MMTRLKSRAASTESKDDVRITEMVNGVIITRPAKKFEEINTNNESKSGQAIVEPQVWNLTRQGPVLESKAASVPGINKMKAIHDFIRSNGRI